MKDPGKPPLPVVTRWESTVRTIRWTIAHAEELKALGEKVAEGRLKLSGEAAAEAAKLTTLSDETIWPLQLVDRALQPFMVPTRMAEGRNTVSFHAACDCEARH